MTETHILTSNLTWVFTFVCAMPRFITPKFNVAVLHMNDMIKGFWRGLMNMCSFEAVVV